MPLKRGKKQKTWGDMYFHYVSKGYDYGWAAYLADMWLKRDERL